ncbi:MAG: TonB-dependent receptor [Pseudomonadota bacterium]
MRSGRILVGGVLFMWALMGLLVAAGTAIGGENPNGGNAPASEVLLLSPVVVSGSRFTESATDVPNKVVVIDSKAVQESRAADLGELLLGKSSFNVRGYGNPGSLQTISLRGASANQVLVMIDGRPLNSVTSGGANLAEVMLDQVERVEVIEGPYSHLYGSGAVGGVVNVITKAPPRKFAASALAAYGSANTRVYRASAGDTVGQFGFVLTGGAHLSDGFRPNSDLDACNASGKFTLNLGGLGLSLFTDVYRDETGVPGSKPGPGEVVSLGNAEVRNLTERNRTQLLNNTLVAELSPCEGLTLRGRFFQDLRQLDDFGRCLFYDPLDVPPYYSLVDNRFADKFDTLIFGGSLEAEAERGISRLVAGADWHYDSVEVSKSRTPDSGAATALPGYDRNRTSYGVFARERLQICKPLAVYLGARFDQDTTFGKAISPDAGFTLMVGEKDTLRGSVAEVYRAPTFNEMFWPGGGNPDLKPESGWSSELGWRRDLVPGKLTLDMSLFYWRIKDKINWRLDPATFGYSPENIDKQETKGATVSLAARPVEALELQATYTLLDARQRNLEMNYVSFQEETVWRRADIVPRHQMTFLAAYSWAAGTKTYLRGLYESKRLSRFKNPGEPLEPVLLLWAGASQRLGDNLELFLEAENLLDEDYSLQAGLPGDGDYPAPPLNFLGGLRLRY